MKLKLNKMNLDYQIAKDYLQKLPEKDKENLCKSILKNLKERKKTKKEIESDYTKFLRESKSFNDFKLKYGIKK